MSFSQISQTTTKLIKSMSDPSAAPDCFICHKLFSITRRRHKCKSCLKAVCADCGQHKLPVPSYDPSNTPHRVCTQCYYKAPHIKKSPSVEKLVKYEFNQLLTDPTQNCLSVWYKIFNGNPSGVSRIPSPSVSTYPPSSSKAFAPATSCVKQESLAVET